jgi:integrase
MAKRPPREASLVQYRRYVRRYEEAGRPDPEAWLDSLTPHGARVARAALRWAYPDVQLRWREASRNPLERSRTPSLPLYLTAARVSEFCALRPEHVRGDTIYLPRTKSGLREHPLPLHPSLDPSDLPIGWAASTLQIRFRSLSRRVGFRVHAHLLRSTAATHMLEAGTDVTVVQQILGHASLDTTLRYLQIGGELKRRAIEGLG